MQISLAQYRTVDGKWQFAPVERDDQGILRRARAIAEGDVIGSWTVGGGKSTSITGDLTPFCAEMRERLARTSSE